MRHVRLLEARDLVARQGQLLRGDRVVEVLELRRADDRRRHAGLVEQPRERNLSRRDAARRRNVLCALDDREVGLRLVEAVAERIGAGTRGEALTLAGAVAGEQAARERAP